MWGRRGAPPEQSTVLADNGEWMRGVIRAGRERLSPPDLVGLISELKGQDPGHIQHVGMGVLEQGHGERGSLAGDDNGLLRFAFRCCGSRPCCCVANTMATIAA